MKKFAVFAIVLFLVLQGSNAFKKGEKGKSKPKPEVPRPPPEELKVEVMVRY